KDRGRLYRILPDGYKHRPCPKLASATTAELVQLLEHPNSWHRETAARLLYQRQDKAAVEPLKVLAAKSQLPQGRMHSLYVLAGLSALDEDVLLAALQDKHAQIRRHAVLMSEIIGPTDKILQRILLGDRDLEVRYQLALSVGQLLPAREPRSHDEVERHELSLDDRLVAPQLAFSIKRDLTDRWIRLAWQSSLRDYAAIVVDAVCTDLTTRPTPELLKLLEDLSAQVAIQDRFDDVHLVVDWLNDEREVVALLRIAVARGLMIGLKKPNSEISKLAAAGKLAKMQSIVDSMLAKSTATAVDEKAATKARLAAIDTLGMGKFADLRPTLVTLIDNRQPTEVQLAALATLGKFTDVGTVDVVLKAWPGLSPQVREPALEVLFARPERVAKLLDAVEAGTFRAGDIPPARVQTLTRGSQSESQKARVAKLLGSQMLGRRADVIAAYREALTMPGNVETGRLHFKKNCSSCHKAEGFGHEIGPNLASIKTRGADAILTNVLDPSREVNPQFVNYEAVTDDGRTITGLIAAESATAVTLKRAEGQQDTVLRVNLEELSSTGLSLMPEGLEKTLDKQALADVIAYLMQLQ
ncbi:MAG: c-type cytochrome, partial [Planctomycetaceae bacterium]|nr:c-type cytochrome [Planctomycetaceae bacterium]